jgi:uncharacterized membrane protein
MRMLYLRERLRVNLWFIPSLCVLGALILAIVSGRIDERVGEDAPSFLVLDIDVDSARSFLTALSSSTITLTTLVFSITILVLQLASNQFTPRVLRTFLRDRKTQFALGIFVATFTYSMMVLRDVRGAESAGDPFVPQISITVAFLLVFVTLVTFVAYIHHVANSIRVSSIVDSIGDETRALMATIYDHDVSIPPPKPLPAGEPIAVIRSPKQGIVTALDRDGLVEEAQRVDCVFTFLPHVGDFVPSGGPLIEVRGRGAPDARVVLDRIGLEDDRTMDQDPAFGFRQLVDIGERALSPAVNDPTTAVEVINQLHDLLRRLASRPFPTGQRLDEEGELRLVFPVVSWEGYVHLAVDEIMFYGATSIEVARRLRAMLEDLRSVCTGERRDVVEEALAQLDATVERTFPEDYSRRQTRLPPGRPVS